MRFSSSGLGYASGAILLWSVFPLFYKQLEHLDTIDIIGHRIIWAWAFMLVVVTLMGQLPQIVSALKDVRTACTLAATSMLMGASWALYVWAILTDHIVEASFGFYLTPIISVVFGLILFRERLSRLQAVSVLLAAAGVLYQLAANEIVPWFGLLLGGAFALYSALRKRIRIPPFSGTFAETLILLPFGIGILALNPGSGPDGPGLPDTLLLMASGVITILPIVWYICAAQRMPLILLGTLFYLAPTLGAVTGVVVYGEPFTHGHAVMFSLIFSGLVLFTLDARQPGRGTTKYKRL